MYLEIITPEKMIFTGEVRIATFPGVDGSFQMLNHHAPLVSLLKEGVVRYQTEEVTEEVKITGGVVEMSNNRATLMADGIRDEQKKPSS